MRSWPRIARSAREGMVLRSHGGAGMFGRAFLDFDSIYLPLSEDGADGQYDPQRLHLRPSALLKARTGD